MRASRAFRSTGGGLAVLTALACGALHGVARAFGADQDKNRRQFT